MRRHRHDKGFTLVELMVSITITGIVAVALYQVSRSATETFNQQQRTAEMQLRMRFALEQLRADVSRAGFMATPNSATDPKVCPRPARPLQGFEVIRDTAAPIPNPTQNTGITPVILNLVGNFASVDEYLVAGISGNTISLQHQTPQWARVTADEFTRIFLPAPGGSRRLLRVTSPSGEMQFVSVVSGTYQPSSAGPTSLPTLVVTPSPLLVGSGSGAGTPGAVCGITGLGVGASIAPISMVQYRIANVAGSHSDAYSLDPAEVPLKTDLVREEFNLTPAPVAIPGSLRIVGEFAVDLDATIADDLSTRTPRIQPYVFGDSAITRVAGSLVTLGAGTAFPERVRSVIVRFSIRDRDQDPSFGWVARSPGAALSRFVLFPTRPGSARVRTVTTEVALPNLAIRNL